MGRRDSLISPRIQPMDQISIALVYSWNALSSASTPAYRQPSRHSTLSTLGPSALTLFPAHHPLSLHDTRPLDSQSMTSGARYHLVATYSVMNPFPPLLPASGGGAAALRARPKSQIFKSQLELSSRLDGLRSRCKTLAVCRALRPRTAW